MRKLEKSRQIKEDEIEYLYRLNCDNITLPVLNEMFATTLKRKAMFNPYDWFYLPANKLYNKEKIRTTVGRYLFNVFILTPELGDKLGYINETLTEDGIGDVDNKMSKLLLEDIITSDIFIDYIDRMQWLGFNLAKSLNTSMTSDLLLPPESVVKRKQELIQKYKKEIEKGDVVAFSKVEKELLDLAKSELQGCLRVAQKKKKN